MGALGRIPHGVRPLSLAHGNSHNRRFLFDDQGKLPATRELTWAISGRSFRSTLVASDGGHLRDRAERRSSTIATAGMASSRFYSHSLYFCRNPVALSAYGQIFVALFAHFPACDCAGVKKAPLNGED